MIPSADVSHDHSLPLTKSGKDVFSYVRATYHDALEINSFFATHEEVSFCSWQRPEVTRQLLMLTTAIAYIARDNDGRIVGAIIGGIMGTRGTVNHLAVAEPCRAKGIGRTLFGLFRDELRVHAVRRLFLFVDDANPASQQFWCRMNFKEIRHETTLECDI